MTRRKPPGLSFETWIERQIRQARERGEFDDLPGHGEPIADLGKPHDDHWWIKQKLRDEDLSYLPPALALRKEASDAYEEALAARSEDEVRRIVAAINERIRATILAPPPGPSVDVSRLDAERVVREWRARRSGDAD